MIVQNPLLGYGQVVRPGPEFSMVRFFGQGSRSDTPAEPTLVANSLLKPIPAAAYQRLLESGLPSRVGRLVVATVDAPREAFSPPREVTPAVGRRRMQQYIDDWSPDPMIPRERVWEPQATVRELQQHTSKRQRRILKAYKLWLSGYDWDEVAVKMKEPRAVVRGWASEIKSLLGVAFVRRENPRDQFGRLVAKKPVQRVKTSVNTGENTLAFVA
jgi:hypothetical protein